MLQEDSNGESTFEIINKKNLETESVSGNTNPGLPKPAASVVNAYTGNLLSNVQPPSTLPDFKLWSSPSVVGSAKTDVSVPFNSELVQSQPTVNPSVPSEASSIPQGNVQLPQATQTIQSVSTVMVTQPSMATNQFPNTEFSAAIPPSKGVQHGPTKPQMQGESSSSGGLRDFFGVLSKVAEKAKSSVDTIITTLDPQMSEYLNSAGDTKVTVTSENEEEVSAIRDAFHTVFGKAWVSGVKLNMEPKKMQSIGFENGLKNAEDKIQYSYKFRKTPTVAIENILFQQNESWFDLSLLILKDTERQITVQTFSQPTPVPVDEFLRRIENELPDLNDLDTEQRLAAFILGLPPNWQFSISGLTRKEVLLLAAKSMVKIYKQKVSSK